ncbi:MAG: N-formylglutamate amidohydrolase [Polyangiaceae bacterium]
MSALPPFHIEEPPESAETPLLVEVPHAGVHVDEASLAVMTAPLRAVGRDADLFVDRIFGRATEHGATFIAATHSRFVIDLNRGPFDFDGLAVEGGAHANLPRGLIWRTSTEGDPILARRLSRAELDRRRLVFYDAYHQAVSDVLERKRSRFGFAILLCAHSMPSHGRRGNVDVGVGRADVVPGSRGRTSASGRVIDEVERVARELGFSVKHDDPYKGGFSTGHYGRPAEGIHAIQIELARRLYMDEDRLVPIEPGFSRTSAAASAWVAALGALTP